MESKLEYLKEIYSIIQNVEVEVTDKSLQDCHHAGLFSLVIGETEPGYLKRVFYANTKIKPYAAQLHTHKYAIKITAVKGIILHHQAFRSEITDSHTISISEFIYNTPLQGGDGLKYLKETNLILKDYIIPIGSSIILNHSDIHTISCSKGSIWIVEEYKPDEVVEDSRFFGVPFRQKKDWYKKPFRATTQQFRSIIFTEISRLIMLFESINLNH